KLKPRIDCDPALVTKPDQPIVVIVPSRVKVPRGRIDGTDAVSLPRGDELFDLSLFTKAWVEIIFCAVSCEGRRESEPLLQMMEQVRIARITETSLRIKIGRKVQDRAVAFARCYGERYLRVRVLDQRCCDRRGFEPLHLTRMRPDDLGVR